MRVLAILLAATVFVVRASNSEETNLNVRLKGSDVEETTYTPLSQIINLLIFSSQQSSGDHPNNISSLWENFNFKPKDSNIQRNPSTKPKYRSPVLSTVKLEPVLENPKSEIDGSYKEPAPAVVPQPDEYNGLSQKQISNLKKPIFINLPVFDDGELDDSSKSNVNGPLSNYDPALPSAPSNNLIEDNARPQRPLYELPEVSSLEDEPFLGTVPPSEFPLENDLPEVIEFFGKTPISQSTSEELGNYYTYDVIPDQTLPESQLNIQEHKRNRRAVFNANPNSDNNEDKGKPLSEKDVSEKDYFIWNDECDEHDKFHIHDNNEASMPKPVSTAETPYVPQSSYGTKAIAELSNDIVDSNPKTVGHLDVYISRQKSTQNQKPTTDKSKSYPMRSKRSLLHSPIFSSVFRNSNPSKSLTEKFFEGSSGGHIYPVINGGRQYSNIDPWCDNHRTFHGVPHQTYGVPNQKVIKPFKEYGLPKVPVPKPFKKYGIPQKPHETYGIPFNVYGLPNIYIKKPFRGNFLLGKHKFHRISIKPFDNYGLPRIQLTNPGKIHGEVPQIKPQDSYGHPIKEIAIPFNEYGLPKLENAAPFKQYGIPHISFHKYDLPVLKITKPFEKYGAPQKPVVEHDKVPQDSYGLPIKGLARPFNEYGLPKLENSAPFRKYGVPHTKPLEQYGVLHVPKSKPQEKFEVPITNPSRPFHEYGLPKIKHSEPFRETHPAPSKETSKFFRDQYQPQIDFPDSVVESSEINKQIIRPFKLFDAGNPGFIKPVVENLVPEEPPPKFAIYNEVSTQTPKFFQNYDLSKAKLVQPFYNYNPKTQYSLLNVQSDNLQKDPKNELRKILGTNTSNYVKVDAAEVGSIILPSTSIVLNPSYVIPHGQPISTPEKSYSYSFYVGTRFNDQKDKPTISEYLQKANSAQSLEDNSGLNTIKAQSIGGHSEYSTNYHNKPQNYSKLPLFHTLSKLPTAVSSTTSSSAVPTNALINKATGGNYFHFSNKNHDSVQTSVIPNAYVTGQLPANLILPALKPYSIFNAEASLSAPSSLPQSLVITKASELPRHHFSTSFKSPDAIYTKPHSGAHEIQKLLIPQTPNPSGSFAPPYQFPNNHYAIPNIPLEKPSNPSLHHQNLPNYFQSNHFQSLDYKKNVSKQNIFSPSNSHNDLILPTLKSYKNFKAEAPNSEHSQSWFLSGAHYLPNLDIASGFKSPVNSSTNPHPRAPNIINPTVPKIQKILIPQTPKPEQIGEWSVLPHQIPNNQYAIPNIPLEPSIPSFHHQNLPKSFQSNHFQSLDYKTSVSNHNSFSPSNLHNDLILPTLKSYNNFKAEAPKSELSQSLFLSGAHNLPNLHFASGFKSPVSSFTNSHPGAPNIISPTVPEIQKILIPQTPKPEQIDERSVLPHQKPNNHYAIPNIPLDKPSNPSFHYQSLPKSYQSNHFQSLDYKTSVSNQNSFSPSNLHNDLNSPTSKSYNNFKAEAPKSELSQSLFLSGAHNLPNLHFASGFKSPVSSFTNPHPGAPNIISTTVPEIQKVFIPQTPKPVHIGGSYVSPHPFPNTPSEKPSTQRMQNQALPKSFQSTHFQGVNYQTDVPNQYKPSRVNQSSQNSHPIGPPLPLNNKNYQHGLPRVLIQNIEYNSQFTKHKSVEDKSSNVHIDNNYHSVNTGQSKILNKGSSLETTAPSSFSVRDDKDAAFFTHSTVPTAPPQYYRVQEILDEPQPQKNLVAEALNRNFKPKYVATSYETPQNNSTNQFLSYQKTLGKITSEYDEKSTTPYTRNIVSEKPVLTTDPVTKIPLKNIVAAFLKNRNLTNTKAPTEPQSYSENQISQNVAPISVSKTIVSSLRKPNFTSTSFGSKNNNRADIAIEEDGSSNSETTFRNRTNFVNNSPVRPKTSSFNTGQLHVRENITKQYNFHNTSRLSVRNRTFILNSSKSHSSENVQPSNTENKNLIGDGGNLSKNDIVNASNRKVLLKVLKRPTNRKNIVASILEKEREGKTPDESVLYERERS